jgi:prepilin-type processing-associated H-X9-DG protein
MQLARSRHTGGVNAALCDGSVRFIRNTISITTWRALGTASGGETLGNDF